MRRLLTLLSTLLLPRPRARRARPAWFAAEPVDGPAEIDALGDVDLARDGTGGVVYLKRDAGVPQVFLSRLTRRRLVAAGEALRRRARSPRRRSARPTAGGC